jgi:hypothetical protein
MRRRWLTLFSAAVIAISAAAVSSCEQGTAPRLDAPPASAASLSAASTPVLVRERTTLPDVLSLTHLIGVNGGTVQLAGHALELPAGALLQPTLVTLRIVPSGYIEMEATAVTSGLLGRVINIGARGFEKPVKLHLTYVRAVDLASQDEARLTILKKVGGYDNVANFIRIESTVDTQRRIVTAELDNFSGYMMAVD